MSRYHRENVEQFLRALPTSLRQPVEQLRLVQKRCDNLKGEYNRELRELKAKYKKLYGVYISRWISLWRNCVDPVYDTRARLIRGKANEEIFAVPGFWLKVLLSSGVVGGTINRADEEVLKFLVDVRSESAPDGKNGFQLVFRFASNPFFTPNELRKTYILQDGEDNLLLSSTGCSIDWAPHRNPKFKAQWKRGRQTMVETESFFNFFDPPKLPAGDGGVGSDLEQVHNVLDAMEDDFQTGLTIKDVLIPDAVSWFTGEIAEDSSADEGSSVGSE